MRERAVAFTCTGQREKYLRKTLESWLAVRGIEDWSFVFSFEPCQQVFPLEAFYDWAVRNLPDVSVMVNKKRLGCTRNTRQVLAHCFREGAQFTVLAEEDIQVSTDVLEYFSWAASQYHDQVPVVCSHVKAGAGGRPDQVCRARWFSPLVWGCWASSWYDLLAPTWSGTRDNFEGWDGNLRDVLRDRGLSCLFPVQSRALHFGEISTLTTSEISRYLYDLSRSECFQENRPHRDDWTEVPFDSVPRLVV